MSGSNWRVVITLAFVVISVFMFRHTLELWTMTESERIELQDKDPGALLELQQKAIRLGLDLQGGIHVVLRVKLEELDEASKDGAVDRAIEVIRNRIDALGVAEPIILKQGEDRIVIDLPGYTDAERAEELIGQTALLQFKLMESIDNANIILVKLDSAIAVYEKNRSGTADEEQEAEQVTAEEQEIATELNKDAKDKSDILADLIGFDSAADTTGVDPFAFDESFTAGNDDNPLGSRLELFLRNSKTGISWPAFIVNKKDRELIDKWLNLPQIKKLIPADVEFAWSTRGEIRNNRETFSLYVLKRRVQFLGKYLENISLRRDATMGGYTVDFKLSGEGKNRFAQLTGSNIDKPLAITLDDRVESAPFISSKIRGSGQITLGGDASIKEARNMEIVLKAGALPAPVEIIEKNVVGATLGADSIRKGFYSSMVGLALVLLYIGIYYRLSGFIADVGLVFNLFFLLAILAGLGATLTMPGIAGIILTIGISVDANILIFERIREELRTGKTVRAAIDAGYNRAFVAIFDSHVTTLITAGALFLLGSGPIKGFAVTLFWGVTISLYTAYVITRQIFNMRKKYSSLSI